MYTEFHTKLIPWLRAIATKMPNGLKWDQSMYSFLLKNSERIRTEGRHQII